MIVYDTEDTSTRVGEAIAMRTSKSSGGLAMLLFLSLTKCETTKLSGQTPTQKSPAYTTPAGPVSPSTMGPSGVTTPGTPPPRPWTLCSPQYSVPATGNPYLAGVPDGSQIAYAVTDGSNPVDQAPANSPILAATIGDCIKVGAVLGFQVSGSISYNRNQSPSDANGDLSFISPHQKGALLGKSNITAPLNSLLGVFLGDGDPSNNAPPPPLDFSTSASRTYSQLAPLVGQIFYIGTGRNADGSLRQVVVPPGATRLYFAVMDAYQWNNNVGNLSGAILE